MTVYVCDKCNKHVEEKLTTLSAYPHWENQPKLVEWAENIRKERGEQPQLVQRYHHAWSYSRSRNSIFLCGPMHEETDQEYFVRWISGKP